MNRADAFLQAIRDAPEDDTPRLIFADWLEEQGDPASVARAEFIRVQCALATLPEDDDRRWALETRQKQLLWQHGKHWARPLRRLVRTWEFRRGFIEGITVRTGDFLANGDELFRLAPIRHVRLLGAADLLPELAGSPHLARMRGLDLRHQPIDADHFRFLMRSTHLQELHALNLRGTALCTTAGMRLLATWPALAALRSLDLSDHPAPPAGNQPRRWGSLDERRALQPSGLLALAESPYLTRLEALHIGGGHFTEAALAALLTALLPRLTALDLNCAWIPTFSDVEWASPPQPGRLRQLRLARSPLPPRHWRWFISLPHLRTLTTLCVTGNYVGDVLPQGSSSLEILAVAAPHLPHLTTLELRGTHLGDADLELLAGCPDFGRLERLCLDENLFGHHAIRHLVEGPLLGQLRSLSLQGPGESSYHGEVAVYRIGPEGAKILAGSAQASNLVHLDLGNQRLGTAGVEALATSPHLAGLTELGLWKNNVYDEAADALLASPHLTRLVRLDLRSSRLSEEVRRALRQRFGPGVCYGKGPSARSAEERRSSYLADAGPQGPNDIPF
jgi:uncharacterized protein (TIGR02996 family)